MQCHLNKISSLLDNKANLKKKWSPLGVIVKVMGCGIMLREFKLQSRYYVYFQRNTLEPTSPTSYGLNSTGTALLEGWIWQ